MKLESFRPTRSKIILFLVLVVLLFLNLLVKDYIGLWFTVVWFIRLILFFPILALLELIGPFLGSCGDVMCTPIYWQVICYTVGVFYAYTLSALVINPSTRTKGLKIVLSVTSIFLLGLGTLFLFWQFNSNLVMGIAIQSFYGWLIFGLITYIIAILLIYYTYKNPPKALPTK